MPHVHPPATPGFLQQRLVRVCARTLLFGAAAAATAQEPPWSELGRQGVVRVVVVPGAQAADRAAYERQIARLCGPAETCFINFYGNAEGLALELPLPESVAAQATAVYRRSAKQGAQLFRFSCRLVNEPPNCF